MKIIRKRKKKTNIKYKRHEKNNNKKKPIQTFCSPFPCQNCYIKTDFIPILSLEQRLQINKKQQQKKSTNKNKTNLVLYKYVKHSNRS